jgi:hypothetical protein
LNDWKAYKLTIARCKQLLIKPQLKPSAAKATPVLAAVLAALLDGLEGRPFKEKVGQSFLNGVLLSFAKVIRPA